MKVLKQFKESVSSLNLSPDQWYFIKATLVGVLVWPFFNYWSGLDNLLSESLLHGTRYTIGFFSGTTPKAIEKPEICTYLIQDYRATLLIGKTCNGKSLYFLLIAFIFAIPKRALKTQITWSIIASLILYFFNMLRIVGLFFIAKSIPSWFDTFHHSIFQILMYVIIFAIWMLYLAKSAIKK
jgi:exosortase/archaeosortase family protein